MKYIITENQLERLSQEEKILELPSLLFFNNDWNLLQKYLEKKGNPKYSIEGGLNLYKTSIESLGNLTSVGGSLLLRDTPIKSLGNLTSVEDYLNLAGTKIKSLGNLTSVGGDLNLKFSPLSIIYTEEKIRNMVEVTGKIYM